MSDLLPITLQDMITELRRELRTRQRVYLRLIQTGKLQPHIAERQMGVLEAIIEHLEKETDSERGGE